MSVIHQPRKPELDARVLVFPAVLFLLLSVLLLRLWYYQVVLAQDLAERGSILNETQVSDLAPRGQMYDRNGVLLAGVRPEWVVTGVPAMIDKDPTLLPRLGKLLQADPVKLKRKLEEGRWKKWLPTPIYIGTATDVASRLAECADEFPGIDIHSQPMRYYPDPKSFSHLMGNVWVPSQDDVDRINGFGKDPAEYVGKNGLEWKYEQNLMGAPGATRMELDSKHRPTKVIGRDAPTPGDSLVLSLDKNLQQIASQALSGYRGAVVAIDPSNGEILCMASSPTYDLNLFHHGISNEDFTALNDDPTFPLMNRATSSAYAPGSTFKIVTAIAAMEQGVFDTNRTFYCGGGVKVGNRFFHCMSHHGAISFHRALVKSCNAYFMSIALQVKRDAMIKAALDCGLYQKTGVDLRSERRGVVATDAYMTQVYPKYRWPLGDTANLGIGQGILAVTPIQMANLMALVANGGTNYKPHIVRAFHPAGDITKTTEIAPEEFHHIDAPLSFWEDLKSALVDVIEGDGTAARARIPGIIWGGKTGSAEEKKGNKTHAWFVGFAPFDKPKIAICVFVEQGGHGGETAAPIARQVVERYLASKKPVSPATP